MSEKFDKVKKHFKENKKVYVIGGSCLVVGAVIGFIVSRSTVQVAVTNPAIMNWKPVSNVVQVQMTRPGNKSHVIQCLEDSRVWPSIRAAAEDLGIGKTTLLNHLKGTLPDANGLHFAKLAEI